MFNDWFAYRAGCSIDDRSMFGRWSIDIRYMIDGCSMTDRCDLWSRMNLHVVIHTCMYKCMHMHYRCIEETWTDPDLHRSVLSLGFLDTAMACGFAAFVLLWLYWLAIRSSYTCMPTIYICILHGGGGGGGNTPLTTTTPITSHTHTTVAQ